jgi:hypothetical protein
MIVNVVRWRFPMETVARDINGLLQIYCPTTAFKILRNTVLLLIDTRKTCKIITLMSEMYSNPSIHKFSQNRFLPS